MESLTVDELREKLEAEKRRKADLQRSLESRSSASRSPPRYDDSPGSRRDDRRSDRSVRSSRDDRPSSSRSSSSRDDRPSSSRDDRPSSSRDDRPSSSRSDRSSSSRDDRSYSSRDDRPSSSRSDRSSSSLDDRPSFSSSRDDRPSSSSSRDDRASRSADRTSSRDDRTSSRDDKTSSRDDRSYRDDRTSSREDRTSSRDDRTSSRDDRKSYRDDRTASRDDRTSSRETSSYRDDSTYRDCDDRTSSRDVSSYRDHDDSSYRDRDSSCRDRDSSYRDRDSSYRDRDSSYRDRDSSYRDDRDAPSYRVSSHRDSSYRASDRDRTRSSDSKRDSSSSSSLMTKLRSETSILRDMSRVRKEVDEMHGDDASRMVDEYASLKARNETALREMEEKSKKIREMERMFESKMTLHGDMERTKAQVRTLDVVFIIDATGSMSSHMQNAKNQINAISDRIRERCRKFVIRYACVAYRDHGDGARRLEISGFSPDTQVFSRFVGGLAAMGGADGPEDMAGALAASLDLEWQSHFRSAVIIADAPCHGSKYHSMSDDYPAGDPHGLVPEDLLVELANRNVEISFARINSYTNQMTDIFQEKLASVQRQLRVVDINSDPSNFTVKIATSILESVVATATRTGTRF